MVLDEHRDFVHEIVNSLMVEVAIVSPDAVRRHPDAGTG